jgi:hypothetical protein
MTKEERREYDRNWHKNRPKEAKLRKQRLQGERIKKIQKLVWEYKSTHSCVDCGEIDPIVLDFDHIGTDKQFNISDAASKGLSWVKIQEEIAKCETRCSNCHRRVTYYRRTGENHGHEEEAPEAT